MAFIEKFINKIKVSSLQGYPKAQREKWPRMPYSKGDGRGKIAIIVPPLKKKKKRVKVLALAKMFVGH